MKSDLIDIAIQVHATTGKAILVSDDGERANAVWLPLAQIEVNRGPSGRIETVTVPEWLALDKGLI